MARDALSPEESQASSSPLNSVGENLGTDTAGPTATLLVESQPCLAPLGVGHLPENGPSMGAAGTTRGYRLPRCRATRRGGLLTNWPDGMRATARWPTGIHLPVYMCATATRTHASASRQDPARRETSTSMSTPRAQRGVRVGRVGKFCNA